MHQGCDGEVDPRADHFIVKWPHDRGQVYAAFIQLLAASAGGFGGHFMRQMINHVFLKQED